MSGIYFNEGSLEQLLVNDETLKTQKVDNKFAEVASEEVRLLF